MDNEKDTLNQTKSPLRKVTDLFGKPKVKKAVSIVKTSFTWLVVAIAVFMMLFTIISVNTVDKQDRNLFGFNFFAVQSDSMAATDFKAGDIIISKRVDVTEIKEGDIITFVSDNPDSEGEVVTHKVRRVINNNGTMEFVTYGTTTGVDDEARATVILGKYVGKIPGLARFFLFLKTTPGYIICILIPFLLLILSQGISCIRLFRAYKKEQTEALEAERKKIEEERAESQRMMAELLALKEQLAAKDTAKSDEPTDQP